MRAEEDISPAKIDIAFAWSSGKDSALGLYELLTDDKYNVVTLLTTVTEGYDRVSMHGVRRELLRGQARSIGLPLIESAISQSADNAEYEARMREQMEKLLERGITAMAFADLFLEDVRQYRLNNLAKVGMDAVFPLWKIPTPELARRFISLGFKTVITCVDTEQLDAGFTGREYDAGFLADLPAGVDPCGENGEFHSFAYDGPLFSEPIRFKRGELVLRDDRFCFCDLLPE